MVMASLQSHKGVRVRELIEWCAAEVPFLPAYSSNLNPIEMVFSKIKRLLRTMACRTRDAPWPAMHSVLDHVSPSEPANCFRHCGYVATTAEEMRLAFR